MNWSLPIITLSFQALAGSTIWVDLHIDNPGGPSTSDMPDIDNNPQVLLIPNYSRASADMTFWGWNALAGSNDSAHYLITSKYLYGLLDAQPIPESTLNPILSIIVTANRSSSGEDCDVYIVSIDALGNGSDGGNVYKSLQSYTVTPLPRASS